MGLRGKLEAVLYASEEPVTLAQLAALFGEEALGEQSAATSGDPAVDLAAPGEESVGLLHGSLDEAEQAEVSQTGSASAAMPPNTAIAEADGSPDRAARARQRAARQAVAVLLQSVIDEARQQDRGVEIREIAGGYQVATKPEYHDAVRAFARSLKPPMKLSLQALETLAVVAYKQPVTGAEISEVRGVDSGGVLGSLIGRKLVATAGRKQVVGRPILYKTTKEFLLRFGLKDLLELPSVEEFEKIAGELRDGEQEPAVVPGVELGSAEDRAVE